MLYATPPEGDLEKYSYSVDCKDAAVAVQQIYNNCNYDNTNQWGGEYTISGTNIVVFTEPGN